MSVFCIATIVIVIIAVSFTVGYCFGVYGITEAIKERERLEKEGR